MQCYFGLVGEPVIVNGHKYFGIWRHFAAEVGATQEDHPAWDLMAELGTTNYDFDEEWDGYFPSLDIATGFQTRFRGLGYSFGIIAIHVCESTDNVEEAKKLKGFLGLDVSNTEPNSVLMPIAVWRENRPYKEKLAVLWDMISRYARFCVNQYGLLDNYEDAVLLRDYSHALEQVDKTNQTVRGVRILAIQEILD